MQRQDQLAMYYQAKDIIDHRNIQLNYLEQGWSLLGFEITAKAHLKLQIPGNSPYEIVSMYHLVILSVIWLQGTQKIPFMPLGKESFLI